MPAPDLSVFGRLRSFDDYQRLQEEFELKKQQAAASISGQDPASVKLANEIQKARASGDVQRLNDLQMSAKLLDRGVLMTPEGQAAAMAGYADVLGQMKYGEQQGAEIAKTQYEPARAGMVEQQKLEQQLSYSPQITGAEASAKVRAEDFAKTQAGLGGAKEKARQALDIIDQIKDSPGLSASVGMPDPFKGRLPFFSIPGTPAADFDAKLAQLKGKQFLEAFESLKGGGQITQVEGEKATEAIARMQTSQSEAEFKKALNEFRDIIIRAQQRAEKKAASNPYDSFSPVDLTAPLGELPPNPGPPIGPQGQGANPAMRLPYNQISPKPIMASTPEEAMLLPPGTVFITPEGKRKVRP